MIRHFKLLIPFALTLFTASSAFGQSQALPTMTNHVRESVRTGEARFVQRLPLDQVMQLNIVLPLSDPAGLKSFLQTIYNPRSPLYHHYLTPAEFTVRFGPTQAQYDAVVDFVRTNGFQIVGGSRDGMDVQIKERYPPSRTHFT